MSKQTRYEIIRDFETQIVYSRASFPMGTKGLSIRDGQTSPNGPELQQVLALWGPAIKPGDPAHISFVQIKDDHIQIDINGGPVHRKKWYQRVQIAGANGQQVSTGPDDSQPNPHGSYLDVYFSKYVPEMTAAQLRNLLYPALDFTARNKEEAYLDTVPPKVKEAIKGAHALVGMSERRWCCTPKASRRRKFARKTATPITRSGSTANRPRMSTLSASLARKWCGSRP